MSSDLSNFLKDELTNTLGQLLSKSVAIESINKAVVDDLGDLRCIDIGVKFEFSEISSNWNFLIPEITATKFEYLMLGGSQDLKEHIDEETTDAVNEMIANVCGGLCTAINAQGFTDISSIKSQIVELKTKTCKDIENINYLYSFNLSLHSNKVFIYVNFDEVIVPYLTKILGVSTNLAKKPSKSFPNSISELSQECAQNLQLLFNVKLKLSVRLGTKNFLLKDILGWDIGEIIELEQMVSEPLDILVNGMKIGEGEAVIVEGKFGLKIKNIGNDVMKLSQVGL